MSRFLPRSKRLGFRFLRHPADVLFLLIGFLFIFTSTANVAGENKRVRIAMAISPLSSPFIIAFEKGYFKEVGLEVDIKQVKGGHLAFNTLAAGEADIATSSEAVVMFNSFKRNDFSLFCTFVNSDNDVKILAHRDSGIRSIHDLRGKKVATIKGTSAHFFLNHTLLMKGIAESELKISGFKPQQATHVLQNKQFDAVTTWEPFAHLAKKELGEDVIIVEHERVYIETFNAITKREYASKNKGTLIKITQALVKANKFINSKPAETQLIVAKKLNKKLDVIKSTWDDFSFAVRLDQWLLTSLEAEARWAMENGFVKEKEMPNYLEYINLEPLKKLAPEKVTIYK
ncbi:MAG: ABC transporter substrate-binding protein [Gammaproteobacteria bacterium]|nr:ABC transporter substrate-binding protein [Gammaproteobacteria bacterium]